MRLVYALLLALALVTPTLAQTPGDCETGRAQAELDVSDVRATLFNTGSLFFGQGTTSGNGYTVPKASGNSPLFAFGLWTGGLVGGELRMAGATYDDFEFFPGPLLDGGALPDPDDCSAYDRIYVVTALDVEQYEATGFAPADLRDWPVGQGAPAVDAGGQPIVSSDIDRVLNLAAGERPRLSGSQTAFWVMNDVGNEHENFGTAPLGIEVAVTAFSVLSDDDALDQATVYRYAVTNKGPSPIEDFAVGFFSDPDLGDASDDMVGVDTTRALAFVYNASNTDSQYGTPPAFGYDLLSGEHQGTLYFTGGAGPTSDPSDAEGFYNFLLALWNDGTPITEGGNGYATDGPETTFTFPGDPVEEAFWSELNVDGNGTYSGTGTDRKDVTSVEPVTLAPGETRTVDLALVFGQGTDFLDSITELRAASDRVQAAYDAGALFAPGAPPTLLATPTPTAPADGAAFEGDAPVTLSWQAVPGATAYRLELSSDPGLPAAATVTISVAGTSYDTPAPFGEEAQTRYWRVRAEGPSAFSYFSDTRSFTTLNVVPDFLGEGRGIVEVARPEGPLCTAQDANDWGCARGLGNTVFLDANAGGDYAVSVDSHSGEPIERLRQFVASLAPAAVEMRFTEGPHWAKRFRSDNTGEVWSVPFELWNVGTTPDDPSDDVRMIPFILQQSGESEFVWADRFPRMDPVFGLPATSRVYGMMPDRRNGYDLFAQTAAAIGAGGEYVDTDVTDTPVDPSALLVGDVDPFTGEVCPNTGSYVSYCYRNTETSPVAGAEGAGDDFVQPLSRVVLVDLSGDGTTPPAGTVIRFLTTDVGDFVVSDEAGPVASAAAELRPVRPNPSRGAAVIPFELAAAGAVRLSVLDALGRTVAVLAEGVLPAGPHDAELAAGRLASGVYVVVLEAGGERLARTVTVAR